MWESAGRCDADSRSPIQSLRELRDGLHVVGVEQLKGKSQVDNWGDLLGFRREMEGKRTA